ncbi:hypothetical protein Tco_0809118 [Tanacetum coccineum]
MTSSSADESQNHPEKTQTQNVQQIVTTTVSNNNAKFPYLKKDEYETWAMKMEYWIMNTAKLRKQANIKEGGEESVMSTQEYIRKVVEDVGYIKNYLKNQKLDQVVGIINSNALLDLTINLKDLSGTISVFSPKPLMHYLNIIMRNLVRVFHKNTVSRNSSGVDGSGIGGSGVGGSVMLNEE